MTVALVTGANSGIGRATAIALAGAGYDVVAGMRDPAKSGKLDQLAAEAGVTIDTMYLDVTDDDEVRGGIATLVEDRGGVDILVNNAGIGWNAVTEDVDIEAARVVFETNFWGALRCAQAVLPGMREHGSGHIVQISSIAGRIAAIGQVIYSASKWALEGMSEALAQEVAPFGIRVSIIEPGVTRTAILPKNVDHPEPTAYTAAYERMFEFYAAGVAALVQPEVIADTVLQAITTDEPRLRYQAGWGGDELVSGRAAMTDEQWVELGALAPEPEGYWARFTDLFGLTVDAGRS